LGIGLGLAVIFGFRGWQGYKNSVAEDASSAYTNLLESLENDDDGAEFLQLVEGIRADHGGTPYAVMASFAEARYQVEKDKLPEAERALRWAIDKGSFREFVPLARLRLARILNQQKKHQDALDMLDDIPATAFVGHVEEIRGDIYYELGETAQAATAYRKAQSSGSPTASGAALQMKIDDLAVPVAGADDKS